MRSLVLKRKAVFFDAKRGIGVSPGVEMDQRTHAELEKIFQELIPNDEIGFEDVVERWMGFVAKIAAEPCGLTPEAYSMEVSITRHLLEMVGDSASPTAKAALTETLAQADAVYRKSTDALKNRLADMGEKTPWYLLLGPKKVSSEGHPDLWSFYQGSHEGFSAEQLTELDALAGQVLEEEGISFLEILQYWRELVVNVEAGYDNNTEEYDFDLWQSRHVIEEVLLVAPDSVRDALLKVVSPWDDRFRVATRDIPEDSDRHTQENEAWFLKRIPREFRLESDELDEWTQLYPVDQE